MRRPCLKNKGFMTTYFLGILSVLVTLTSLLNRNEQNRLNTAIQLKQLNRYLSEEAVALSTLKCALKNHCYEDISDYEAGVGYSVSFGESEATVWIDSPYPEVLIVQINKTEGTVIDYSAYRD